MAVLYAAKGGSSNSNLYTINPVSGVATTVGAIGYAVTGLTFDPTSGILYGSTSNLSPSDPKSLITINTSTGAGTLVGALGTSVAANDISCDSTGQIYGWINGPWLWSIDKATGTATEVGSGSLSSSGAGMGFDSNDNLYALLNWIDGDLWLINTVTGTPSSFAVLSTKPAGTGSENIPGADIAEDGQLWFIVGALNPVRLCTVSVTGAITQQTTVAVAGLDAIAWSGAKGSFTPPPQGIEGVVIAFSDSDTTLERDPTWTRIDQ